MSDLASFLAERRGELLTLTGQHVVLVVASTAAAVALGLPLGVAMTRRPRLAHARSGTRRRASGSDACRPSSAEWCSASTPTTPPSGTSP